MNIDKLQDAPGVYAVQLPDGVVKFGQSKTVKSRVRTHVRTLRSYGVPVLDVAAVYVNHCEDAEKDLFARLTAAGYQRSSNSRESYIIPWDVATGILDNPVRAASARVPVGWTSEEFPLVCANPACLSQDTRLSRVVSPDMEELILISFRCKKCPAESRIKLRQTRRGIKVSPSVFGVDAEWEVSA